jgi:hypothetical protein
MVAPTIAASGGTQELSAMTSLAFDGSPIHTPVGYYTYTVRDDHWHWSDGLYELHGYAPHAVPASTELMLGHKHPDDAARVFDVLETAIRDGRPFSCYHRIVDVKGSVRSVMSVGRGVMDSNGQVEKVEGFMVDLTGVRDSENRAAAEEALLEVAQARSAVEQAKGMLMLVLGCGPDEAFGTLRRYASGAGLRLNELARRLVEEVAVRPLPPDGSCREALLARLDAMSPDRD